MTGHNIRFHRKIRKIIFELSSIPLLSGALRFVKRQSNVMILWELIHKALFCKATFFSLIYKATDLFEKFYVAKKFSDLFKTVFTFEI